MTSGFCSGVNKVSDLQSHHPLISEESEHCGYHRKYNFGKMDTASLKSAYEMRNGRNLIILYYAGNMRYWQIRRKCASKT